MEISSKRGSQKAPELPLDPTLCMNHAVSSFTLERSVLTYNTPDKEGLERITLDDGRIAGVP